MDFRLLSIFVRIAIFGPGLHGRWLGLRAIRNLVRDVVVHRRVSRYGEFVIGATVEPEPVQDWMKPPLQTCVDVYKYRGRFFVAIFGLVPTRKPVLMTCRTFEKLHLDDQQTLAEIVSDDNYPDTSLTQEFADFLMTLDFHSITEEVKSDVGVPHDATGA